MEGRSVCRARWLLWPQLALIAVVSLLAYLRLLPALPAELPYADKALHFLLFGAAACALDLWLGGRDLRLRRARIPLALVLAFAAAAAEELAQTLSAARTAEVADLAADLAGMICFIGARRLLARRDRARAAGRAGAPPPA